jgi:hypothetical protein
MFGMFKGYSVERSDGPALPGARVNRFVANDDSYLRFAPGQKVSVYCREPSNNSSFREVFKKVYSVAS